MNSKIIIFYDLQKKSNGEKARIIQKLYGYRDKSNYTYSYTRKGLLDEFNLKKEQKTILNIKSKENLAKVSEILKTLKVKFEIAKIQ